MINEQKLNTIIGVYTKVFQTLFHNINIFKMIFIYNNKIHNDLMTKNGSKPLQGVSFLLKGLVRQ